MYKKEVNMKKIETLREKLYEAIDKGNKSEILSVSERLDKEIVKIMKKTKDFRQLFISKKQMKNMNI